MYPIINSKLVYEGIIVNVKIDDIALDNGQNIRRELVLQRQSVAVLLVTDDGDLLMVRQYRHPVGKNTLEIPAGILDGDEKPHVCAIREAGEETGFIPQSLEFVCAVHSSIGISTELVHIFIGRGLVESAQNLDFDEFVTIERHSLHNCLQMVKNGEITAMQTVIALQALQLSMFTESSE